VSCACRRHVDKALPSATSALNHLHLHESWVLLGALHDVDVLHLIWDLCSSMPHQPRNIHTSCSSGIATSNGHCTRMPHRHEQLHVYKHASDAVHLVNTTSRRPRHCIVLHSACDPEPTSRTDAISSDKTARQKARGSYLELLERRGDPLGAGRHQHAVQLHRHGCPVARSAPRNAALPSALDQMATYSQGAGCTAIVPGPERAGTYLQRGCRVTCSSRRHGEMRNGTGSALQMLRRPEIRRVRKKRAHAIMIPPA
jgi:hypothetical protein